MKRGVLAMAMLFAAGFLAEGFLAPGCLFAAGARPYGQIVLAAVPRQKSVWFDNFEKGIARAGEEFRAINYTYPPTDETEQLSIIEEGINQGVRSLLVVPGDANASAPVFARARQQGIVVITHESPNQREADFNIEMVDGVSFGESFMDELVQVIGPTGEFAIFVGSLTVPSHNAWADAAIAYQRRNYPGLVLIADRFPVAENRDDAYRKTLELLAAYPRLQGIFSFGSQGAPGAGQALRENPRQRRFAIFGTTPPSEIAPFLKDRSVTKSLLWRPSDAAYAMAYIAKMVFDGWQDDIKQGLVIPGLGEPRINGRNIVFDMPLAITAANVDDFDF